MSKLEEEKSVHGPLADCYVLSPVRSREVVMTFLERHAPIRVPAWDTKESPSQLDGFVGESTEARLLEFLQGQPSLECTLYFRCIQQRPETVAEFAMVSFNGDGSLIFGLSGHEGAGPGLLLDLEKLSHQSGYWTVEEAPACSRTEFEMMRARRQAALGVAPEGPRSP